MYKAVIFDLDGTLLNTLPDIRFVLNSCLKKFGLPEVSEADTIKFIGNGAKLLVERALGDRRDKFNEVFPAYTKAYAECDNSHTQFYPNEAAVLQKLKERGIKLAIITNKPQATLNKVYNDLLKEFEFDFVLGDGAGFPLKPDPESALEVIKRFNVKPSECLFVGDGETDVLTARAAKTDCLSALWGYRDRQTLTSFGAKNFAENFNELLEFILKS